MRTITWQPGDRVYLYSAPGFTPQECMSGTVTEVVDGAAGPICRVHWDGTPDNVGSWHPDGSLECWTLPAVKA